MAPSGLGVLPTRLLSPCFFPPKYRVYGIFGVVWPVGAVLAAATPQWQLTAWWFPVLFRFRKCFRCAGWTPPRGAYRANLVPKRVEIPAIGVLAVFLGLPVVGGA